MSDQSDNLANNFNELSGRISAQEKEANIHNAYMKSILEKAEKPVIFINAADIKDIIKRICEEKNLPWHKTEIALNKLHLKGEDNETELTDEELYLLEQSTGEDFENRLIKYLLETNPHSSEIIKKQDPKILSNIGLHASDYASVNNNLIEDVSIVKIDSKLDFFEDLKEHLFIDPHLWNYEFALALYRDFGRTHEDNHTYDDEKSEFAEEFKADKKALFSDNKVSPIEELIIDYRILKSLYIRDDRIISDTAHAGVLLIGIPSEEHEIAAQAIDSLHESFKKAIIKQIQHRDDIDSYRDANIKMDEINKENPAALFMILDEALHNRIVLDTLKNPYSALLLEKYLETRKKYDPALGGTPPDLKKVMEEINPDTKSPNNLAIPVENENTGTLSNGKNELRIQP